MNSIAIVSLLAAVATLTSAAPTGPAGNSAAVFGRSDATVCAPGTGYFQNCSNGFRGCCKADACGSKTGCPDDKPGSVIEPVSTPVNTPPTSNPDGFYFACTGNGFRGYCKSDPCQTWCPDYKFGTYEPISTPPVTASSNKLWYVCASNGFRGECSKDACAQAWCPDYKFGTYEPISAPPVTPTPSGNKLWYVCASNGFRGECSKDPCALAWCPDYKYGTYEAVSVSKRSTDPTICAPGTGYFQSCSNGFRGCCKADACGNKWCPDYKFGTYEPVSPVVKPETVTKPAPAPVNPEPVACPPVNAY